ncbi:MAG: hypothetical protein HZB79_03610 [Deltaproteobacteria bacterium]|nr:hypothetical protein [Deltaproteobacteria bacterium]
MKNKPLVLMFFVFTFTLTSTCLYAADKPASANLPSIIKTIPIPWPVSGVVDEKENRVFILARDERGSAVFVLNGRDSSIIKKISIKEEFFGNIAGNSLAYNPDTKRLYALVNLGRGIAVIDAKTYTILDVIKNPRNYRVLSINVSKRNMIYQVAVGYPYIFEFNGGSNKLKEEIRYGGNGSYSAISEDGNFLYIAGEGNLLKFDIKAKKATASLPITLSSISIPLIDEKNGLIFLASAYKMYVIDLPTFKTKDEKEDIPFPNTDGASLALNPTTNHLFVPTYNDSVSVIDVPAMKILTTIKVGQTVRSIAVNSQTNRVYVTLVNYENKVVVIQDR